jgi:hypothetical protein
MKESLLNGFNELSYDFSGSRRKQRGVGKMMLQGKTADYQY